MWNNELVTAVSIWTVGYVIGQVPVNLLLTRVPPRYVISGVSQSFQGTRAASCRS